MSGADVRVLHCETCGGDGSFDETGDRWMECRACAGTGQYEVELLPVTADDLEDANG